MKRRHLYAFLFAIPGCLIAVVLSMQVLFVVIDSVSFLVSNNYIQADPPEIQMLVITGVILLIFWMALIAIGYSVGTRLENRSPLNGKHILLSGVLSLLLFVFIWWWSARNNQYEVDSGLCSKYCFSNGYTASVMPPIEDPERSCYCSNYSLGTSVTIPIEEIDPETLNLK